MPEFYPFVMERMMSKWENTVDVNLSESGVHPLKLGELLALAGSTPDALAEVEVNYPQVNGSLGLRAHIAAMYPGATPENVLVTVGAAEANYLAATTLLEPGDHLAFMQPNYMQIWGVARNRGVDVRSFHLVEDRGWALDVAELDDAVGPRTKMIAVCNPNNPTGRIMTAAEMDAVVAAAERVGAWILADEVYRGAERLSDSETSSFYGRYDKVLAMGSMSKAYGLPGLRVGWAVGPPETLDAMWARHEYTTISATMLSNRLAEIALSPAVRPRILERTRAFIRNGYPVLEAWMREDDGAFSSSPPQAAAIAFVRYRAGINSTELTERLRTEASVLIVPGDHFGLDGHLRISFGLDRQYLGEGLARTRRLLANL